MPIYNYQCFSCDKKFESIEKLGTRFAYCPVCRNIGKRYKVELPSPAQIRKGVGGVYSPKFEEKEHD